jgi:predicted AlkP superfamily phosphohydrolase/phosphomutase
MVLLKRPKAQLRPKAVVVGLDGVPYTLLKDLISKGRIPNMASIFDQGYFGQMSVSIPEISSVSWSSFMTGTQSGEHGIYGFVDLEPGTYNLYFPNFTHLKAPTLWDELAARGKRAVVINMPATYPAREINGALISGFVAIDINKAVYPTTLIPHLSKMNYRIDLDITRARKDHDFLLTELDSTLGGRERAVEFFWKDLDWDLFIVVITGTDRLLHFLFDAYRNGAHPYHNQFLEYFTKVDSLVGKVYEKYLNLKESEDSPNQFCMLSDHGFTGIKSEVYLNRWLQENGLLKFSKNEPESMMDMGPGSVAFALDPSRIYINLKTKYPLGTVDLGDYDQLRQELKQGLEELSFENGDKIAKRVYLKEEVYQGPYESKAPDLVILPNRGYDVKGKVKTNQVFGTSGLSGMHTHNDAFFFNSSNIACSSIFEIKSVLLNSCFSQINIGLSCPCSTTNC